jgi:hypothetical protein
VVENTALLGAWMLSQMSEDLIENGTWDSQRSGLMPPSDSRIFLLRLFTTRRNSAFDLSIHFTSIAMIFNESISCPYSRFSLCHLKLKYFYIFMCKRVMDMMNI